MHGNTNVKFTNIKYALHVCMEMYYMKFGNYEILSSFCFNVLIKFLFAKEAKIRSTNYAAYLGTWLSYHLTYIITVSYLQTPSAHTLPTAVLESQNLHTVSTSLFLFFCMGVKLGR